MVKQCYEDTISQGLPFVSELFSKIIFEVWLKGDDLLTADVTIESMAGKFLVGTPLS